MPNIREELQKAREKRRKNAAPSSSNIGRAFPFSFTLEDEFIASIDSKVSVRSLVLHCDKETELTLEVETENTKNSQVLSVSPKITTHANALKLEPKSTIRLSLADKKAKCFVTVVFAGE